MPHFVAFFVFPGVVFCNESRTSFSFNSSAKQFLPATIESSKKFQVPFKVTHMLTILRLLSSYTMMAKPLNEKS